MVSIVNAQHINHCYVNMHSTFQCKVSYQLILKVMSKKFICLPILIVILSKLFMNTLLLIFKNKWNI